MLPVAVLYAEYPVYDLYESHTYYIALGVLRGIILII